MNVIFINKLVENISETAVSLFEAERNEAKAKSRFFADCVDFNAQFNALGSSGTTRFSKEEDTSLEASVLNSAPAISPGDPAAARRYAASRIPEPGKVMTK